MSWIQCMIFDNPISFYSGSKYRLLGPPFPFKNPSTDFSTAN